MFLFVNRKSYGTELSRVLMLPLNPIQKALARLEKGGIIVSDFEGKTRLYQFNPAFPLLAELELLLKKAYTLLSAQEKKLFAIPKHEYLPQKMQKDQKTLWNVWEKLCLVNKLAFKAKSEASQESGWNGRGEGEVVVSKHNDVLIFQEKGSWCNKRGESFNFTNQFRWTLDRNRGMISLEHLRHGIDKPVFLFHLAATTSNSLSSIDSHLCEEDTYFGHIFVDQKTLRLNWRVIGPKKNEEIHYHYSFAATQN